MGKVIIGKYYLSHTFNTRIFISTLTDRDCEVLVEDPGVLVDVLVVDILTLVHLMVVVWFLHLWYEVI